MPCVSNSRSRILFAALIGVCLGSAATDLRTSASFDEISDRAERSRALFSEFSKIIVHPRCMNCHADGERPSQGAHLTPHVPIVVRGVGGFGAPGLHCNTCHQAANFESSGVPGHPQWRMPPASMGWQGKSLRAICEEIKDPRRNGGKSLTQIREHVTQDTLVGWSWQPGAQREAAPGTQQQAGDLVAAWIVSGASCPAP